MPYLKKCTPDNEPVDCRILTAALDLFVERGFHNVSVHDVQKQANVSIGSIYNHFGGKEGIAKALYHHLVKEFEEMMADIIADEPTIRRRCNRVIAQLFEYTETRRNIIAFVLHTRHREFLSDEPPLCTVAAFQSLREIVQQGMEQGEIRRGDIQIVTAAVFGGAVRMIHLRLDGVITEPLTTYYDEVTAYLWQGMGG